ncbi:MAG: fibronectin type III domain-containing protein [Ignavibacteriaceae bacterium]|nr:fibronectin type III domain-containing protein [Ignavibacteriaceae bacterium]
MKAVFQKNKIAGLFLILAGVLLLQTASHAQYKNMWMSVGALHNWYSEIGCELEEQGFVQTQQDGLAYPAIYPYQDMQAAKGHWIGAKNFTDESGTFYPVKVVTIGPRNPQFWAAYPVKFEMTGKFDPPVTSVDGNPSYQKDVTIDKTDPTMKWDRQIVNTVNTQLGITFTRKIYQFSNPAYDNFIVHEYTYKNTGNTDADDDIELPNNTVTDVYFYFTNRLAINKQTRYVIANSTGWGKNTMSDARGDGIINDPDNPTGLRAQFSWHGYSPEKTVAYDNIGGPIFERNSTAARYLSPNDTIGRLGAWQFVGMVTLHADKSATDKSDDPAQPSTTDTQDSDSPPYLAGNNAFNVTRMQAEFDFITKGHGQRHAYRVQANGKFEEQTGDPALGGTGGHSINNGYGPYTLAPGDSIRIVWAEAAAGIGYERGVVVGRQFKAGQLTAIQKNLEFLKGKDSLMATFSKIKAGFDANWATVLEPPRPPATFDVKSGGDRVSLSWTKYADDPNPPTHFQVFRALGNVDSTYYQIAEVTADVTRYDDFSLSRGFDYYYYVVAVDKNRNTSSSRYWTQTYDPANLKRQAGTSLSQIRVVPNPYNSAASPDKVRFPGGSAGDRIAFYDIPGECKIRIYTEMGELIKTIEHNDGSGDEFWNQVTESGQIVVSGIYIAVIEDTKTGEKHIVKFVIIR